MSLNVDVSKRLVNNIIGNYILKMLSMVVSFFLTPAYMNYFCSNKVLGMWFTLIAILNWIMLFDFGVGAGVRNNLVTAFNQGNNLEISKIISSGFVVNTGIVIIFCIIQHFVVEYVNWYIILGLSEDDISNNSLRLIIHILAIGISLRMYVSLISHIYYALQKAIASSIISLMSNLMILIFMLLNTSNGNDNDIVRLAFVHAICYNLPAVVAVVDLKFFKLKDIKIKLKYMNKVYFKLVTGMGLKFFYLQILITLAFGVKEIMITWFVGADSVVDYNVYQKVIGIAGTLFSLALVPLWSEVTEMYVRGQMDKIIGLYCKGMKISFLIGACQSFLVIIFPFVNQIWLGNNSIEVSFYNLIIFAFYNLVYMIIMLNYNCLCGMSKTKSMTWSLTMTVILNFILSYLGSLLWNSWIVIILASVISSIPTIIITTVDIVKKDK